MNRYKENDIIKCKVTSIKPYGIFVNIDSDYNGLIHISEINGRYIKSINKIYKIGEIITARIIGLDKEKKQMSLTTKSFKPKNKEHVKANYLRETYMGFLPLEESLPLWMSKAKEEMQNK